MINQFIHQTIPSFLSQGHWLTFLVIFVGGVLTSISPCVLSMVPVTIGYIGGYSGGSRKQGLIMSLAFVVGLGVTFAILGLTASAVGKVFGQLGSGWYYALAAVSIIMGLSLLGVINLRFPTLSRMPFKAASPAGAFLVGLLFGLVASPCATPVLAVIMTYVASKGQPVYGGALLFVYGLGHGLPLLIVGTFTAALKSLSKLQRWSQYTTYISGAILIGLGLYLLTIARW